MYLRCGPNEQQKRAFYRAAADNAAAAGIDARNLLIVLTENTAADWSFGNGHAHYLDDRSRPKPHPEPPADEDTTHAESDEQSRRTEPPQPQPGHRAKRNRWWRP